MSITLYIDVNTGEARTSLSGPIRQRLKLFLNDKVPLRIAFVRDGVNITTTILESGNATMKVGIRAKPGQGSILSSVTSYTMDGSEAVAILPLDAAGILAHFADANLVPLTVNETTLMLEVEVANQAGTSRVTYYQKPCIVAREVNT